MNASYKDFVIYQIYPRSFLDTDGDGIGDLKGVTQKLPYVKSLGVDAIWLSPVYCSPNADYGYDISDYLDINPEYGTMKDFEKLVKTAHELDLKVMMDLVINHTSDQHEWFTESKSAKDNPYRDYYYWRAGRGKKGNRPPNNWTSFFTGKAWKYDAETHEWYLHLFAENQPDLNYGNPELKRDIKNMITFWLDKGVDAFRCDVITLLAKKAGLPDGKLLSAIRGIEHFKDQPQMHNLLKELKDDVFSKYDCFTVGESVFITVPQAISYTGEDSKELDMVFSFDHMNADNRFGIKYFPRPFRLKKLKSAITKWQQGMYEKGWNANYLENHDQPRVVGRYCSDKKYIAEGAKMMAVLLMTLTGTPYIYQGQEIGMTNIRMTDLSEYRDVETKRAYHLLRDKLRLSEKEVIRRITLFSRDNARTPMQWSNRKYADFSITFPWLRLNPNYPLINVENQENDAESVLNFYRKMIAMRKEYPELIHGEFVPHLKGHKRLFVYEKRMKEKRLLIIMNFHEGFTNWKVPGSLQYNSCELLAANLPYSSSELRNMILRPYEALIYELK